MRRKTHEEYVKEVFEIVGDEYTVVGEYKNSKENVLQRHNVCGFEWSVKPSNFTTKGSRCPKCQGKIKSDTVAYKKEVFSLVGEEYDVLDEYKNCDTKILHKHNLCGNFYKVSPYSFLKSNHRCPHCAGNAKKTTEEYKREVKELGNGEYEVLEEYKGKERKILHLHKTCGNKYSVRPNDFRRGNRCPLCFGNQLKTTEEYKREVKELGNGEYEVLEEYKGKERKILHLHKTCGNEYLVRPGDFRRGVRCPLCCNNSKMEKSIEKFLKQRKIRFETEFKLKQCRNKNPLPFDFAVFDEEKLSFLIELDGEQHFAQRSFGAETIKKKDSLEQIQHRDRIKNNFCRENNIRLYRIPYWKKDQLEDVLDKILKHNFTKCEFLDNL